MHTYHLINTHHIIYTYIHIYIYNGGLFYTCIWRASSCAAAVSTRSSF